MSVDGAAVDSRATIDVVVGEFGADYHVLHVDIVAIATSASAGDKDVGVKLVDYPLGSEGSVHLADATLFYAHISVVKEVSQLLQLLVHGYDNSYFHCRD